MTAPLRVAVFVPTFNAGETTRGIELARALVQTGARRGREVGVTFVAPRLAGPSHEGLVTRAGFPLEFGDVVLDETTVASIMWGPISTTFASSTRWNTPPTVSSTPPGPRPATATSATSPAAPRP